jgi:mono/diheme cytochrome c family protein
MKMMNMLAHKIVNHCHSQMCSIHFMTLFLILFGIFFHENALSENYFNSNATLISEGREVFLNNCSGCHGKNGDGDGFAASALPVKPRAYRTEKFKYGNRPSEIVRTIELGRSSIMPSFAQDLSYKQRWAVAHFVWSLIPSANRISDDKVSLDAYLKTAPKK